MMTIDFDKLRLTLLPHCLRQGALLEALFASAYAPLRRVYAQFTAYADREALERQYGPTVRQLRQAIADHLCIGEDSIEFGEVADRQPVCLPRVSDNDRVAVDKKGSVLLWSDDMVWWNRQFTITLPSTYRANEPEIREILDRWKMAASRYTINYK